ncbi:MAG: TrmH family RNA methyltransferase [Algicola sp.]|nr:TrmH family RNA methyltransferase [Algicola sp.]
MKQLDHYSTSFTKRTFPITLICENVTNAPNVGSLFRTADAFGVEALILCGEHIPLGRKMTKTSRSTEKSVDYKISVQIIEITDKSKAIHNFKFSKAQPVALIIGDENFGVSEAVLYVCDEVIHIEMYGQNSSMNVVQATSVALYEITKQFL